MSVNSVTLLGHLGKEPETVHSQNGPIVKFSLATTEKWKDKSGAKQEKTEWHQICVFGQLALNCGQYMHKGSRVYLEGKLSTHEWVDKLGSKHYSTQIIASNVLFLDKKDDAPNIPEEIKPKQITQDNSAYGGTSFDGSLGKKEPTTKYDQYNHDDLPF